MTADVCTDDSVAIDDCEFDRVGLPGLMVKNGAAGEGSDGATTADALVRDGEPVLMGASAPVALGGAPVTKGWFIVGRGPV